MSTTEVDPIAVEAPNRPASTDRLVGQPVRRIEDARLLAGLGRYVDDRPAGHAWHLAIRRSDQAHARIRGIDVVAARALKGVHGVFVAADLAGVVKPAHRHLAHGRTITRRRSSRSRTDKVRYVGEPVVAHRRRQSLHRRRRARTDRDRLRSRCPRRPIPNTRPSPARRCCMTTPAPTCWSARVQARRGRRGIRRRADHGRRPLPHSSQERGRDGEPLLLRRIDVGRDALTLYASTHIPGIVRDALADPLDLPGNRLRVVAPDVGGSFGGKGSLYPEEILVCAPRARLGRTIKWTGDRLEDLVRRSQAFDEIVDAEIGSTTTAGDPRTAGRRDRRRRRLFDLSLDLRARAGPGRQLPARPLQASGRYRGAVRGVATPQAADRALSRRRPADLDLRHGAADGHGRARRSASIRWRCAGATWSAPRNSRTASRPGSSGTRPASSNVSKPRAKPPAITICARSRRRPATEGRWFGIGLASYAELTGHRLAHLGGAGNADQHRLGDREDPHRLDRRDHRGFGVASHGQGLETTLAQIIADDLGARFEDIRVVQGDSDAVPMSTGTYASRSAGARRRCGKACVADAAKEKIKQVASHLLEANADDIDVTGGRAIVAGTDRVVDLHGRSPRRSIPTWDAAGRGARGTRAPAIPTTRSTAPRRRRPISPWSRSTRRPAL